MSKMIKYTILLLSAIFLCSGNSTVRKSRGESFFGLHFDFHAAYEDSLIGKNLSDEMIDSLLVMAKVMPDIQVIQHRQETRQLGMKKTL